MNKSMRVITDGLVEITEAIAAHDPELIAHGFLGGEYGYGGQWDNDVFTMRPSYCDKPNFLFKPAGLKIEWYKWIGRSMTFDPAPPTPAEWADIMLRCLSSLAATQPRE